LQEVEPDECREPEPILAVIVSQQEAQENERASEPADDHMHFHNLIPANTEPRGCKKSQLN
jgi:hypothetical protein